LKKWYKYKQAGKTFVYVDESGFDSHATRTHGWALRGEKVYGLRSGNRRPRTSLLAARIDKKLDAEMLFQGTTNTVVFNIWLKTQLCPKLNNSHVVVMDNAAFHKSKETEKLIKDTGAILLFLPPYSPELNPIECDFAALKKIRQYKSKLSLENIINMYSSQFK
jgi:transposase